MSMKKNIFKIENIPQFWVISLILIYGLLLAEFSNTLNSKIFSDQLDSVYSIFMNITCFVVIAMTFAIWLISSFLFHMFAILFNGKGQFREFLKLTGLFHAFSTIVLLILIFMVKDLELTQSHISRIFETNQTMRNISLILNITGFGYYIMIIPITKYFYKINWGKAIGALVIPIGSIYLLGQFFSNYVL